MKAVIIIPTYNEAENIGGLIEVLNKEVFPEIPKKWDMHILVVDDSSPDGTGDIVKKYEKKFKNVHLLTNSEKVGLGGAYMRAMTYTLKELKPDVILEMDADFQHDQMLIPKFLEKIDEGADIVIGSRYMPGGSIPAYWGLNRKILSIGGNAYIRLLMMDNKVHDWTTGFRAIKPWVFEKVHTKITELKTYSFQISFLYFARKAGAKVAEVPLNFKERKHGVSKMPGIEGMIKTFWFITKMRIIDFLTSRFFKFGIVGFVGFLVNYLGLEAFKLLGLSTYLSTLFATELAIISNFVFNNVWTFKDKTLTKLSDVIPQFVKFNVSSLFAVIVQPLVVTGFTLLFGDTSLVRLGALIFALIVIIIPYNYAVYNIFIWKTWKLPFKIPGIKSA